MSLWAASLSILLLGPWVWGTTARGQAPDPHLIWRTVRTDHFSVHYHEPLGEMAQEVGAVAERAHRRLRESLGFRGEEDRTHIVLSDLTDSANGIASVLPRSVIRLFAAAPPDLSPIGDYDDWFSLLVTHEHTHIQHLADFGGVSRVINAIFGRTYTPNAVQPSWFIEGLATYEESRQTSGGRMRSSMFDMFLRMDALSDRLLDLDSLSNDPIRWPHGDIRYLYGSRFVAHIAEHYGVGALTQIGRQYGRQPLPFGLNRMALRATGHTYTQLYDDFLAATRAHYRSQAERIATRGVVAGQPLIRHRDIVRSPRYLPNGGLAYFVRDGVRHPQVRTLAGKRLSLAIGVAALAPHPDGRRVIVSMRAPHRDIYTFDDLFSVDVQTGSRVRLTHGLRAKEPDVSPDGARVAFVTQTAGTSQLELADLRDVPGTHHRLYRGAPYEQVYTPRFSPDGGSIVFSAWRRGGYRDILLYELKSGRVTEITRDRALDTGPVFSRDGSRIFFSSDRDGVPNLYAFERRSGVVRRVTNVLGGAFSPEPTLDGRGLVYVSYGARGFGLHMLTLPSSLALAPTYQDLRPAPIERATSPEPYPDAPYDPLPTLFPVNYELALQSGPLGSEAQVTTTGEDVAGFHFYSATLRMTFEDQVPSAAFTYVYNRLPIRPRLSLARSLELRDDLEVGGQRRQWLALSTGASVSLGYRFAGVFDSHAIEAGYTLRHIEPARPLGGELVPTDPAPKLPNLGWLPSANLTLRYDDSDRQAYDVTTSRARRARLRMDILDPLLGRDLSAIRLRWDVTELIPVPLADNHVLALRYSGGQAAGDRGGFGRFRVGGFPDASVFDDPSRLLREGRLTNQSGIALRGFRQSHRSGRQVHLLQVEYRLPLLDIDWGVSTLPFYVRRIYASVFADTGNAFSGRIDLGNFALGTGCELFTQFEIAYRINATLRLGFARGWTDEGQNQFYLNLGTPF